MRERVDQLGVAEPEIQTSGGNQISVGLPDVKDVARAEKIVGKTARLEFYDWEANALTPNGKTVASQLQAQDSNALQISQGSGRRRPGDPGAGSMTLYDAVKLASKQPAKVSPDNARARAAVLHVRRARERRVRGRGEGAGQDAGRRACIACSPVPTITGRICCPACRRA